MHLEGCVEAGFGDKGEHPRRGMGAGQQSRASGPVYLDQGQEVSVQDEPGERGAWRDLGVYSVSSRKGLEIRSSVMTAVFLEDGAGVQKGSWGLTFRIVFPRTRERKVPLLLTNSAFIYTLMCILVNSEKRESSSI